MADEIDPSGLGFKAGDRYLDAVRDGHVSQREIVDLVEQTYRWDADGKAETPAKIGVHPERPNAFLHAMPAWVGGQRAEMAPPSPPQAPQMPDMERPAAPQKIGRASCKERV